MTEPPMTDTRDEAVAAVRGLHRACQTAANDDLSKPQTEKRQRHIGRIDAMTAAIDLIESLSRQLAEAQAELLMWRASFPASAEAVKRDALSPPHAAAMGTKP